LDWILLGIFNKLSQMRWDSIVILLAVLFCMIYNLLW
jgi:hypothetical protein